MRSDAVRNRTWRDTMARLHLNDGVLRVELSRWERVGGLSSDLAFPVSSIESIERVEAARSAVRGLRAPGTGLPRLILLGHWRRRGGGHDFVAAYRGDPGYVIGLRDQRFDRPIVSSPPVAGLDELAAS